MKSAAVSGAEARVMRALAQTLKIMGLPPSRKTFVDRRIDAPTVVWAGLPSIWKLAIFQEGGRQDPGNVLYALDPSWFIQRPGRAGRNELSVTKALHFAADGRTPILAVYKYPRRVCYFGNWLTLDAFGTDSGKLLEKKFGGPMSSCSRLESVTADKVWTRLLMASEGVRVPFTHAFLMPDHVFLRSKRPRPRSRLVDLSRMPVNTAGVLLGVVDFLRGYDGPEVVVKPSGSCFHSGEGVRIFRRSEAAAIADWVISLSRHASMDSTKAVLVEQRLAPPPIYLRTEKYDDHRYRAYCNKEMIGVRVLRFPEIKADAQRDKKDYNERVYVIRDRNDRAYAVPATFFRAGAWGLPTNGQPKNPRDAAAFLDFEVIRAAWSVQHRGLMSTVEEVEKFAAARSAVGEMALRAIIANEKALKRRSGDPYRAQTDMIGLDVMYQLEKGRLAPYVIEVNDHDAAGQHAMDLLNPECAGEHSRAWVEAMRYRARIYSAEKT